MKYRGRFAPSPSGPLHFGSLVCALASYLDAKSNRGDWLLRIEDVDRGRCDAAFNASIIECLAEHGMQSDHDIISQSDQSPRYLALLDDLQSSGKAYHCACTRAQIKKRAPRYDGLCRDKKLGASNNHAVRLLNQNLLTHFYDDLHGNTHINDPVSFEDIVLKRSDQCFAYNLAVVVDDIHQGITHVVRGADLLSMTPVQIYLFSLFSDQHPRYIHIPVACTEAGKKLSKQNHAKAIDNTTVLANLHACLIYLGYPENRVKDFDNSASLLRYAEQAWCLTNVPKKTEVIVSASNDLYSSLISDNADTQYNQGRA